MNIWPFVNNIHGSRRVTKTKETIRPPAFGLQGIHRKGRRIQSAGIIDVITATTNGTHAPAIDYIKD